VATGAGQRNPSRYANYLQLRVSHDSLCCPEDEKATLEVLESLGETVLLLANL